MVTKSREFRLGVNICSEKRCNDRFRRGASTLLVAPLVLSLLAGPGARAADATQKSTPDQLVDALNGVFGKQTTNRAVHAKGVVLTGTFIPVSAARCLPRHHICNQRRCPSPCASRISPACRLSPVRMVSPARAAWPLSSSCPMAPTAISLPFFQRLPWPTTMTSDNCYSDKHKRP